MLLTLACYSAPLHYRDRLLACLLARRPLVLSKSPKDGTVRTRSSRERRYAPHLWVGMARYASVAYEATAAWPGVRVEAPKTGERYSDDHVDGVRYKYGVEQAEALLPDEVREWSGVQSPDGDLPVGGNLSVRNDTGAPFSLIANLIRSHSKAL